VQYDETHNSAQASERAAESELLREFLRDRDMPCPVCNYNLRNCQADHCPECGAELDLRVGSIDLKLRWWLSALLAFALPLGFAWFMVLLGAINYLTTGFWRTEDWIVLGMFGVDGLLSLIGFLVLVRLRQWLLRRPLAAQRAAGLGLWLWSVLAAGVPLLVILKIL